MCSVIEGLLRKCATTKRNSEEPSGIVNFRGSTTRVMRIVADVSRPCHRTVMPGQHLQSALWAVPYPKNSSAVRRACSSIYLYSRSGRRLHHARPNRRRQRFCSDYFWSLHIVGQNGFVMKILDQGRYPCGSEPARDGGVWHSAWTPPAQSR